MTTTSANTCPAEFLEWFGISDREPFRIINGKNYHYAIDYLTELKPDEKQTTARTVIVKNNEFKVKNSFYWFQTNTPRSNLPENPKISAEIYYPFNVTAVNNKNKKKRFYEYEEKCIHFLKFCGCKCENFDGLVVDHIDYNPLNASINNLTACNQIYNQHKKTNSLILDFLPVGSELLQHIGVFNNVAFDLYIWRNSLFILRVCMLLDEFKPPRPLISGEFFKIITNPDKIKPEFKEIIKKHKDKQTNKKRAQILADYMKERKEIIKINNDLKKIYICTTTPEDRERITEEINRNEKALRETARQLSGLIE